MIFQTTVSYLNQQTRRRFTQILSFTRTRDTYLAVFLREVMVWLFVDIKQRALFHVRKCAKVFRYKMAINHACQRISTPATNAAGTGYPICHTLINPIYNNLKPNTQYNTIPNPIQPDIACTFLFNQVRAWPNSTKRCREDG